MGKEILKMEHITKIYPNGVMANRDVSFSVREGEIHALIGENGSGKSTILKIITGVLTPTTGSVQVDGKISALLELGAGFNMDYTGIENIYLNGTMIGFSEKEIDEKLQDILDFADIGDYVYQPVKTYSSGMFVRLAFAVAINIDPEILIVDEVLAVGDAAFQEKCQERMHHMLENGTTLLFVSHTMATVRQLCDHAIWLNKGDVVMQGEAESVCDAYMESLNLPENA